MQTHIMLGCACREFVDHRLGHFDAGVVLAIIKEHGEHHPADGGDVFRVREILDEQFGNALGLGAFRDER